MVSLEQLVEQVVNQERTFVRELFRRTIECSDVLEICDDKNSRTALAVLVSAVQHNLSPSKSLKLSCLSSFVFGCVCGNERGTKWKMTQMFWTAAKQKEALALIEALEVNTTLTTVELVCMALQSALSFLALCNKHKLANSINRQLHWRWRSWRFGQCSFVKQHAHIARVGLSADNQQQRKREAIWQYESVEHVMSTDNNIGQKGAQIIAQALRTNTTLKTLRLRCKLHF